MNVWTTRIALLSTVGAALAVLLLYAPALEAPFLVPKLAALEVAASLGIIAFALRHAAPSPPRWTRAVAIGVLLVVATSVASWVAAVGQQGGAPYAIDALARWGSLLGIACGTSVLAELASARRLLLEAVTIAAGTVAGLGLLQHIGALPFTIPVISLPGSTFGNRNLAAEVMAMALPIGVAASGSAEAPDTRNVARIAVVLELVFLAVTRARGAWLGAVVGLVMVLWLQRVPWSRKTRVFVGVAIAAATVAAAVPGRVNAHDAGDAKRFSGVLAVLEGSVDTHGTALRTRLGLWHRTLAMVGDHPWLGVGPGNWPVLFPRYAEPDAARDGVLSATLAPRQAHDDALERAAETGVPGLLALVFLAVAVGRAARRRLLTDDVEARGATAGAAGALAAVVVVSATGFPLEMPGTIALTGIALGLVGTEFTGQASRARPGVAYVAAALGIVSFLGAAVRAERDVRASRALSIAGRAAYQDHGSRGATEALATLSGSPGAIREEFLREHRIAQMSLRLGRPADAIAAAQRALAIEPDSPNARTTLATALLGAGSPVAARVAASDALDLLHDYPLALDVRAQAEDKLLDVTAAAQDRAGIADLASHATDDDTRRAAQSLLSRK